jgi:hypothetical protein
MAREEITADKFTCGGCNATAIVEKGTRPEGYHGKVELATVKGETGGEWFACRKSCIRAAVLKVTGDGKGPNEPEDEQESPVADSTVKDSV